MHCRWQTAGHSPAIGGFTPPSPFGQGQSGCPRGIFEKRRSRSAGILAALFVAAVPASAQAAACDSTMMALMYLGGSVDPILAGAADVPERLAAFAEKAAVAEGEAKAEGWPAEVLANMALLASAANALPPDTIFAPAQAVADAAGALCEGMPMPYFPAPNP